MTKEGIASGSALVAAKSDPNANALVKALVADFEISEGRSAARDFIKTVVAGKQAAEMKAALLAALGRAGSILDIKASAEAPAFKPWLSQISQRVAKAAGLGRLPRLRWRSRQRCRKGHTRRDFEGAQVDALIQAQIG